MVVAFVLAVGGRSSEAREMAAPDVGGSLPVSSRRWIRDLRSSNSSQTVEGAAVDVVESVPSGPCVPSPWWESCFWASADRGASGEELNIRPCPYIGLGVFSDDIRDCMADPSIEGCRRRL